MLETKTKQTTKRLVFAASFAFLPSYCEPPSWLVPRQRPDRPTLAAEERGVTSLASRAANFLRIEPLDDSSPPVFVMRGEPRGPGKLVFLHGICGHALGYAQSFARSAAKHGTLIAPQGDRTCEGTPLAKWSSDTAALDERISAAFRSLGFPEPINDVTAIGYSQGASRAEALARKWPDRYTRLVLIAGPTKVSPFGLKVRSAAMMAGTLDRQDIMVASSKAFLAAGRRAQYFTLPNARHGAMGDTPEASMQAALDWLYGEPATNTD
ncbi:MAG TPA: hypothetical protein VJV79_12820 [Polyangiaceae bacterium]|nr:hypothetical protein [Polyangiaceae bacterium]